MIAELMQLVEERLRDDLDVASLARALGTTEYHVRRVFSSLAGMPLSEYVRRRRMSAAASVLDRAEDFSTATCELWLPVERA